MYKLYARNAAGSMAPEALMALLGLPYEVIVLERKPDGSFPDFFRAINPKAEVPTLVMPDGSVMTESAAILIHLADLHPGAMLSPPADAPERARFLRWMIYLATTLYMSDLRLFYPERFTAEAAEAPGIKAQAEAMMNREFAIFADALGDGPFLLGSRMSAVDLYAAMFCTWAPDMNALFAAQPALGRMYAAVAAHPVVKAVWTRNGA